MIVRKKLVSACTEVSIRGSRTLERTKKSHN
jgi:hypothetical protein